jgi:hypothetical protein
MAYLWNIRQLVRQIKIEIAAGTEETQARDPARLARDGICSNEARHDQEMRELIHCELHTRYA